jgi:Mrp family chromosome partitioning ATPase
MPPLNVSTQTREHDSLPGPDSDTRGTSSSYVEMEGQTQALVRAAKSVVMRNDESLAADPRVVFPAMYNSFHSSLLPRNEAGSNFVIGVTSTRPGDGKTLVAANLAVSMALGDERETLLVDLNMRSPKLHSVFAIGIGPGLAEALGAPMVHVARTAIRHLSVMTLGNITSTFSGINDPRVMEVGKNGRRNGRGRNGATDLTSLPGFRHVMNSLKQRFSVLIFDMPAISDPILPLNLTRQMDGLVFVVDSRTTTKTDMMRISHRLGKDRILGFVLNRAADQQ